VLERGICVDGQEDEVKQETEGGMERSSGQKHGQIQQDTRYD